MACSQSPFMNTLDVSEQPHPRCFGAVWLPLHILQRNQKWFTIGITHVYGVAGASFCLWTAVKINPAKTQNTPWHIWLYVVRVHVSRLWARPDTTVLVDWRKKKFLPFSHGNLGSSFLRQSLIYVAENLGLWQQKLPGLFIPLFTQASNHLWNICTLNCFSV